MHHERQQPCGLCLGHRLAIMKAPMGQVPGKAARAAEHALQQLAALLQIANAKMQWVSLNIAALKDLHTVALLQQLLGTCELLVIHLQ